MVDDTLKEKEKHYIVQESIRTLFERHKMSLAGILGLVVMLVFAYRDVEKIHLAVWVLAIGLVTLMQWFCIHSYFLKPAKFTPYVWARLLTLSSGTLATVVGISVLFFLDIHNETQVLLVTLLLIGPIFGSTIFAATYFPIHLFWCLGSTIPLVGLLIFSREPDLMILGFSLLLAGIPSALILGWILANEFKRALATHFENIQLIDALQHEKMRAENISRDKSRFLAAVSHDLRQPLHALDLFHASLKPKLYQPEQKELLELANHSSLALGEMLGALIDISRLDAGKISPTHRSVSLAPLLKECADEMQALASEKGLTLRVRLPQTMVVQTDPIMMKRILRNLLANAVRHTEKGGVLLGTRRRGETVHIEVHDTGVGIAQEKVAHIFDEFYQINNPERDREKGLGLGLSIVQRMANELNHQVYVRSQLGRGSCFSIALPLFLDVESYEHEYLPILDVNVMGLFILVVDDDNMILQGMRELLLGWGCEVLLAESETALLDELSAHDYPMADILISDYRLRNGHTGLEIAEAVQEHFSNKIPTLIISGDVDSKVQSKVKKAGYQWLEKPVQDDVLKQAISELAASG